MPQAQGPNACHNTKQATDNNMGKWLSYSSLIGKPNSAQPLNPLT